MTFWLAWLHLTNFQILLVSFQLRESLPVTSGQILLTGQLRSLTINFRHLQSTLKVLNFAGIKFRDFAIFSLNREIKYQGETFQVYNREIKYPRNLISGGF